MAGNSRASTSPVWTGVLVLCLGVSSASHALRAQRLQGDFVARDISFASGERLPEVRLHDTVLGQPHRDAAGTVRNAVLVLHGTGGTGRGFLSPNFAGELFAPGKLLDTARYYVILPDNIGHGGSSKPSDGLRMKFPHYAYADMVQLQHRLLTEGLGVSHLRLVMARRWGAGTYGSGARNSRPSWMASSRSPVPPRLLPAATG